MKLWIGIDNGTSGSIGWIDSNGDAGIRKVPTKEFLNYQKKGQMMTRIDMPAVVQHLGAIISRYRNHDLQGPQGYLAGPQGRLSSAELTEVTVMVERPFTMSYLTPQVANGLRAFEAMIIALELQELPFTVIDSKQWQKPLLGTGLKGSDVLKKASLAKGKQLWPQMDWRGWKDADGLLIAEWARTKTPF